jgi:uncharacterized SAM-binding protein YcdF (DUF218 family)
VPRDLRKYASNTTAHLIVGGLLLLLVVGLGLIAWIYGSKAALLGFICILGGLAVVGLITLFVFGLDVIIRKINKE